MQEAVTKTEGLLTLHQEYQRNLKAFEVWLEKEQEKLDCLSHLGGDAQEQEATLRDLQVRDMWHPKRKKVEKKNQSCDGIITNIMV